MSIQHFLTSHKELKLSILAIGAGLSLIAIVGSVSEMPVTDYAFVSPNAQCQDADDVLVSLDRSRNGVSLTCNKVMIARSVTP